jgi:hypothetical protein
MCILTLHILRVYSADMFFMPVIWSRVFAEHIILISHPLSPCPSSERYNINDKEKHSCWK